MLAAASKPVLYVGGGVVLADAVDELRSFAATTGMPAVTTLKGIGTLDPASPWFLGMLGMHGTKAANLAVQESDLLLVVGARFDDRVTGKLAAFAPHAKVIHLDVDAAELGKRRAVHVSLQADFKQVLPALTMPLQVTAWQDHCLTMREQFAWRYDHPGDTIYAPLLLKQLSDALPENTVVTSDVGQHQMWVAQHMQFQSPRNHISSSGLGTMGFGLPAAVGAKVARPQDEVVLVSGDGSFMMNVQELGTLRRAQLPVKMVLLEKGISIPEIHNSVYNAYTEGRARLFGYAINRKMALIEDGTVAYMSLLESEMRRFQFQQGDSEGFVNYALTIKKVKMSAMFLAHRKFIRISLRSRGNVDVNLFARKYFNGGGHKNAAGGKSFLSMEETIDHYIRSVREFAEEGHLG